MDGWHFLPKRAENIGVEMQQIYTCQEKYTQMYKKAGSASTEITYSLANTFVWFVVNLFTQHYLGFEV